jgi:hypothetical protein
MAKPVLVPKSLTRKQVVDEYGEVDRKLRLWQPQQNPHQARHAELEAIILSWADDEPAHQSKVVSGSAYQVEVSARGMRSTFTPAAQAKAYELLKHAKVPLMQFFSLTLAEAKAHLGPEFVLTNVPKLQIGPRSVSVVPRVEAVAAKKAA